MRRSVILAAIAVVVVVAGALLLTQGGDGEGDGGDDASPATTASPAATAATAGPTLGPVTVQAGEVEVVVEPLRLDADGATFQVTLDTHAVELDMDLAAVAELEVDGTVWPVLGWAGDGPGGHHREGELTFQTAGPAGGTARLVLDGFPAPVEATWELGG